MPKVTNDNLERLRELSDELCKTPANEYKSIVRKLKGIVDSGKKEINSSASPQTKIKCYESMCEKITILLTNVNF